MNLMKNSFLVEKMVTDGQLPRMLYKYRSLDGEALNRTLNILRDCSLYFANPESFNDPFDCRIYPMKVPNEKLAEYLAQKQTEYKNLSSESLCETLNTLDMTEIVEKAIDDVMNRKGVCCMTGKRDNILMWSHYADSHRGICLGFDVMWHPDFFLYPIRINYASDYPQIPITEISYPTALLKTKYEGWSYEEEFRIYKAGAGCYSFNPKSLRQIIFGCKVEQDKIETVDAILKNRPELSHVELYKAEIKTSSYKLNIAKLKK